MGSEGLYSRLFTIEEANGLLPALRPVMDQVAHALGRLRGGSEIVIRREGLDPEAKDLMERLREDKSVVQAIEKLHDLVDKINQLGCVCMGVEEGLVDFPCAMGEEVVFLCWRYGEDRVNHWHRIEEGFAGRRPLLDSEGQERGGVSFH